MTLDVIETVAKHHVLKKTIFLLKEILFMDRKFKNYISNLQLENKI